jgi:hypothetical protein
MAFLSEAQLETALLTQLAGLGFACASDEVIGPDGKHRSWRPTMRGRLGDALAENESAVQVMGDASLRVIAHELLVSLRENVAVDWAHRESARARLRVLVKRILRKYGYPPDLQDAAVRTVLQQAEALSAIWQSDGSLR